MSHLNALVLLILASSAFTSNIERYARDLESNEVTFRLPGTVVPSLYTVTLTIDPRNDASFSGEVTIRFRPVLETNIITMHAFAMAIDSVTLVPVSEPATTQPIQVTPSLGDDLRQFLRLTTGSLLSPDAEYDVTITYTGTYAENMFGVYLSSYPNTDETTNYLVATQFQPTYARRAFPCFDEPHLKAIFRMRIYAPPQYTTVLANTEKIDATDTLPPTVDGNTLHEFADTVIMSSYLVAFVVSDFVSIGNDDPTEDSIFLKPFRVYMRPGNEESAEFALDFGQNNMVALEVYTEMEYALEKLDKIALPDFAAGAMENWGLVTYREVALLNVEGITSTSALQNIGRIISHENMHMWFGNEVSPAWWDNLWLNEGFANFFENFATDMVLPEWRMMDQFVVNILQSVMQSDAVQNVNPMTTAVFTPSEILGNFNAVAYQKSGSVIRMLQHVMTPELFRQGLVLYLQENSRDVAEPANLYTALSTMVPDNIALFMTNWVNTPGFPLVSITRDAPTANSVTILQHRYYTDPSIVERGMWRVPLNWVLSTNVDFSATSSQAWLIPQFTDAMSLDVPGLAGADWYIFNKQQTGYYRVNYDTVNWINLGTQLNSDYNVIHVLNRAQLIDDSLNLARNEKLNYEIAFDLVSYLVDEPDYVPWQSAFAGFSYLNNALVSTGAHELFQRFVSEVSAPIYSRLGFVIPATEEHVDKFHRNIALNLNCRFGNQDCIDIAYALLGSLVEEQITNIHPDIQIVVYCSALREGDTAHFNYLWSRYLASTQSSEQVNLLNSLGCTSNDNDLNTYMNQIIDPDSQVRQQDRHTILVSTINSGIVNAEKAFDFLNTNFLAIRANVQGLTGTRLIIEALATIFHTEEHLSQIQQFIATYQDTFTDAERASVALIQETISATIGWRLENVPSIETWLEAHFSEDPDPEEPNSSEPAFATAIFVLTAFLATLV